VDGEVRTELSRPSEPRFPYVPGFLFYKEAPHLMPLIREAVGSGVSEDSVLVLDGNGTIHPRGMGIACQMGIALDMPSMGFAKRLLWGRAGPWKAEEGGVIVSCIDGSGSTIGHGIRTQDRRPLYVSKGHRTSQGECLELAKAVLTRALPSPTGLAHLGANDARRSEA
jgi:deoxyribonuclease V